VIFRFARVNVAFGIVRSHIEETPHSVRLAIVGGL